MGYSGDNIIFPLAFIVIDINVDIDISSMHCKSCIIVKHPYQPYPPFSKPHVKHMFDLVYSKVCVVF